MSQSKAKYMSVSQTAHQGLWIRRLLIELGLKHIKPDPAIIFLDNCSTINLSKDSQHHDHTKHIDIQHHFICEWVEDGTYHIIHCPTHLMLANALTKPLPYPTFSCCHEGLRLISHWGGVLECRYNTYELITNLSFIYPLHWLIIQIPILPILCNYQILPSLSLNIFRLREGNIW